jgi:hypothetical protein
VNHTTGSATTPFLRTGIVAALRGVFGGGGSGAGVVGGGGDSLLKVGGLLTFAIVAFLASGVGTAAALTTRQLQTEITGTCQTPGNCPAGERIAFAEQEGLTVDSSGRLWVSDPGRHAVDRFSSAGAYEAQNTGTGSWAESTEVGSVAFSASAGEVFVADSTHCALWGLEATTAAASGKELRPFGATEPCSLRVAADNSAGATVGDLYVSTGSSASVLRIKASNGAADDFTAGPGAGGNELTGPFAAFTGPVAVAPDGDFYVAARNAGGEPAVFQFEPSGAFVREIAEAGGQLLGFPTGLAVDPTTDALLVADNNGHVFEFAPGGTFLRQITKPGGSAFLGLAGLAADSTGRLFVSEASSEPKLIDVFGPLVTLPDVITGPADVHSTTAATLHGEVNPAGREVTECFFEYGPTTAYGQTAECEPDAGALGEGTSFGPVTAEIENLIPGAVYHYRLIAADADGTNSESEDREFVTGATIDATSASEVTATSARLGAEVNPHGLATTYSFQYGTTTSYELQTPLPPAPLGAGETDIIRAAFISGLQPGTVYHYRVIANNSLGTVEGPDHTFTTQTAAAASLLPDDRGWELVSPPLKQGASLGPISLEGGVIQAAADGHAITYYASGSVVSEPAGDRSVQNSQDLSIRGSSGWSTSDLTTPHQHPAGVAPGFPSEYQLFSTDLSFGAVEPRGATPLSPQTGEKTPYLRLPDGSYEPLVTEANVPAGTHFGGVEVQQELFFGGVGFITATPDLSHVLLESPASLVAGFENEGTRAIYEWSAGALTPVIYVPPGTETRCGGTGPACEPASASVGERFVGALSVQVRNAISTDGSRVFFSAGARGLFLRDLPRGETLHLDAPQGGIGNAGAATFQIASADGRRIFFTDPERLTEGSTAAPGKPDLYMCEVPLGEPLACALTDLTANAIHPAEPANVRGTVIGAAADGSSVYFVANGALTAGEGAVAGDCTENPKQPASNSCNLYRYDLADSKLSLVAVLSGADDPDWAAFEVSNLGDLTARVSPDGNWLAFMSERPLTGYDNRDAATGVRDQEAFLYDAQAGGGAGGLLCASCNPTGARPRGLFDPGNGQVPGLLVDHPFNWEGQTLAANIPGWTRTHGGGALYQSRYLSDSGRLFFNAADALVPSDTNGAEDVYQYEPPGVGSCSEASPGFAPRDGGCVDLISSGTSAEESTFMDASENGDDVFFLTASRLTAKDEDKALDLYDARVGGGEAAPVKPVECSGDACQQPAVPPNDATPGSLTFNGAGNVKECPKGKKLQKGKCVKKQQKKAKKHKRKHPKKKPKGNGKNGKQAGKSGHGGKK